MPKSLDAGVSSVVILKIPEADKQAAIDVCTETETLSGLIRESLRREVKRRCAAIAKLTRSENLT